MLYQDTPRTSVLVTAYLTPSEAATYVGITERQVRSLVYRRAIPFTKVGRLLRFRVADLDRWLEGNTTQPGGAA